MAVPTLLARRQVVVEETRVPCPDLSIYEYLRLVNTVSYLRCLYLQSVNCKPDSSANQRCTQCSRGNRTSDGTSAFVGWEVYMDANKYVQIEYGHEME